MRALSLVVGLGLLGLVAGSARAEHVTTRRVVIDPGHGGSNSGTRGHGVLEKHLTLAIASQVAARLRANGVEVHLTRESDRTLTLRQRVGVANRVAADVFISIHANASPHRTQSGYETFILTPRAVDIDGHALRGDVGQVRSGIAPDIALILDDVERSAAQWEAADFAVRVQAALRRSRGSAGDRGVRQDAHHVLLGATMPAILVEVGFLDHPIEGRALLRSEVQGEIADALAGAIVEQLAAL